MSHVSAADLRALRDETLEDARIPEVLDHVASCPECAALADRVLSLQDAQHALLEQFDPPSRPRLTWWLAAAAAVLLVVGLVFVNLRRGAPRPTRPQGLGVNVPQPPASDPWTDLERDALAAGRIEPPAALLDLQRIGKGQRGPGPMAAAELRPSGAVIASDRPDLTWSATRGARYAVTIFSGETVVATSGLLDRAHWAPAQPLKRGRTYQWQVEVTEADGATRLLPEPSMPEALFRVADAKTLDDLDAARAAHPGDHLLLGIVYARAGLKEQALAELSQHGAAHPDDRRVASLIDSVRRW